MKNEIELRDLFAAQLMSGKVEDLWGQARRENISEKEGVEEWVQVSAEESTKRRIAAVARRAYEIADAMIEARKTKEEAK